MPTNALGVLLFATLLVPGFVHRETRRTIRPVRSDRTAFEQTIEIVTVSLVTNLVVGLVVVSLRLVDSVAAHTPDLAALVADFEGYTFPTGDPARTAYVLAWFAGYVAACSALGAGLAVLLAHLTKVTHPNSGATQTSERRSAVAHVVGAVTGPIRAESAWYRAFDTYARDTDEVIVGCELSDGTYVAGQLDYYSTDTAETTDRDLMLGRPRFRTASGDDAGGQDLDRVIVSARAIVRLDISYLPAGTWPFDPPTPTIETAATGTPGRAEDGVSLTDHNGT